MELWNDGILMFMDIARIVTPAKAGVQSLLKQLDSGFRRNDNY
jgi:hypothetical protein